jgi:hypothetical protein
MNKLDVNPEDRIHVYFRKESYLALYESFIYPVNGPNMWTQTDTQDILPPPQRRQPGRPKKRRAKDADEETKGKGARMTRRGFVIKCRNCGTAGHNKSRCPMPPREPPEAAPEAATQAEGASQQTTQPEGTQSSAITNGPSVLQAATTSRRKIPIRRAKSKN